MASALTLEMIIWLYGKDKYLHGFVVDKLT
jgi:hypothetical protein